MALNNSGPISLGGSTTGQSVNLELGLSATAQISFNDAAVRTLTGTSSSTALIMPTNFYGKSSSLFTRRTSGVTETLRWVRYVNSRFIAGGSTAPGNILTSTDGITWSATATTPTTTDVAYGAGVYVMIRDNDLYSSANLSTWTLRQVAASGLFTSIDWNGSLFVATVSSGGGVVYTSSDGITWTSRATAVDSVSGRGGIFTNGSLFIALSQRTTAPVYVVQTSTDGINWTVRASSSSAFFGQSGVWTGSKAIIPGASDPLTSNDGITWSAGTASPFNINADRAIASDGSGRVLLTNNGFTTVALSSNSGSTWTTSVISGSDEGWSIAYGSGVFVIVGNNGGIWTAPPTF